MAIQITKDEEQLVELGIESLTVGYSFDAIQQKSCEIKIICELKVVNDKKFKGGYTISFAIIDDKGQFVGATQEWISDRKEYFRAGLFTRDYVQCSTSAKNLKEIKVYVKKN